MIKTDISKCTGCRMCETACAFYHTSKINRNVSRIKVQNLYETGIDGPAVCTQCKERYCLDCPVEAISTGSMGEVVVLSTACTLCGKCERNCPIGAIEIFEETVYVCDLCGGSPRCVEACTEGAVTFVPGEAGTVGLEAFKKESKGLNASERRARYIAQLGKRLRKQWRNKDE